MHSKNITCKVADIKACGRAGYWATMEKTKATTGTTVIKADRPSYLSWLWRLVSKHLKPTCHCGLRASHLPAVNQDASGDGRPSHKAAYVTFQEHKNKHGWDRHKALRKTWHQMLILRRELCACCCFNGATNKWTNVCFERNISRKNAQMHWPIQRLPEARQTYIPHQPAPITLLQICLSLFEFSSSSTNCLGQPMFKTKWCKSSSTSK